jgi:putative oxidoreductase
VVLDRTVHRNSGRHRANPWIVHAVFAAAAAIELLIITAIYWHNGFSWLRQGYEYTLLWGWICFAIALRGGGPYSVDRAIGKEL